MYKKMRVYKDGDDMTPEQREKWEMLIKMGWRDVAAAYREVLMVGNYTDEYVRALRTGRLDELSDFDPNNE